MNNQIGINSYWVAKFSEIIQVNNKYPVFGITHDHSSNEEYLYSFGEDIVGLVWRGGLQSSLFFYYLNKYDLLEHNKGTKLKAIVDQGFTDDMVLEATFAPLLKLFQSGKYRLFHNYPFPKRIEEDCKDSQSTPPRSQFRIINDKDVNRPVIWKDDAILFTQLVEDLDDQRVQYYESEILKGNRPTIITLGILESGYDFPIDQYEEAFPQFIIDGHHKAQAYLNIQMKKNITQEKNDILNPSIVSIILLADQTEIEQYEMKWRKKVDIILDRINNKMNQ